MKFREICEICGHNVPARRAFPLPWIPHEYPHAPQTTPVPIIDFAHHQRAPIRGVGSGSPSCFSTLVYITGLGSRGRPPVFSTSSKAKPASKWATSGLEFCISGTFGQRDPLAGQKLASCKAIMHTKSGARNTRRGLSAAVVLL